MDRSPKWVLVGRRLTGESVSRKSMSGSCDCPVDPWSPKRLDPRRAGVKQEEGQSLVQGHAEGGDENCHPASVVGE